MIINWIYVWKTIESKYLLQCVMKMYLMDQYDFHLAFIHLENAYDKVTREILWKVLENKRVRMTYIRVISIEVWKSLGDINIVWLTKLFNKTKCHNK